MRQEDQAFNDHQPGEKRENAGISLWPGGEHKKENADQRKCTRSHSQPVIDHGVVCDRLRAEASQ